ncbi:protein phosphatase 1 regulatory subunit 29-like [Erpetoichthys calabaricus]|uniref:protein phosphatase 1 regulatory subunit 29-like n=1 Tax=Erpetoichthys calabaricus TaxID=27687 RepID=UPI00109FE54F|nr:protein phosphatase 1 regulatory subunit 29-like [Erpetoichthys calabaricus]
MPQPFRTALCSLLCVTLFFHALPQVKADCWLIEGDKGYVWLAICSQNQPPYETIPQHINSTVHDLRLNENKLKAVFFSSLSRFCNLTDLNLTKNEISYIEEGAFSGQSNLQVLQLGYNKLTNLTEGMLRGLGRLQYLFVQHNLLEVIAANAFFECPNLISLDLSSNKLVRIDPSTFTGLSRLMVCELAGNPFHCSCELYSFLVWLEAFNNVTRNYDRLQCETPPDFSGYPLLSPRPGHGRNAMSILSSMCRNGALIPGMPTMSYSDPRMDLYENSGTDPDDVILLEPTTSSTMDPTVNPSIQVHQITSNTATLVVQIPFPYRKMYILVQYNNSYVSDVMNLRNIKEFIILDKLKSHTDYTFCVASIRNSQRHNHTCITFTTRTQTPDESIPNASTTTHYIMTILGCLFGMVIVLGVVYYCLRKRRIQEEKQKSMSVKKTILEMRYGPEAAASAGSEPISSIVQKLHEHQHHHGQPKLLSSSSSSSMVGGHPVSSNTSTSRLSAIPQAEKTVSSFSEALSATKGNYMDIRTSSIGDSTERSHQHRSMSVEEETPGQDEDDNGCDVGDDSEEDGNGSASEISTIAKEVDKVNQIINNCIDALKLDSSGCGVTSSSASRSQSLIPISSAASETCPSGVQIISSPKLSIPPPPLGVPLPERPGISGGGFLSPPYREPPSGRPLQRQLSADAAVVVNTSAKKRCSVSSSGSVKSARVFSLDVPDRSPDSSKYTEKGSPLACGEPLERLPLMGSAGGTSSIQHLEVRPAYHCSEHRHSFPALYYEGSSESPTQRASFLKPLTRSKRDAASYSQLSPRHNYSGYSSSPEYSSESTLKIWERFRPYKKSPREEASYVAAGHALRKKVQFAKDEDLHDILDYWKGVSAQQKL